MGILFKYPNIFPEVSIFADDELRSVKERSELLPDSVKKKVKDLEDAYQEGNQKTFLDSLEQCLLKSH